MKRLTSALLVGGIICGTASASVPGERSTSAVPVDADRMDYRPLGIPARAKAGGSLKPPIDDAVFHPITVEMHAEVRSDGSFDLHCDGADDHAHDPAGRHPGEHVDAEPQP
jgi:hypothetical protein